MQTVKDDEDKIEVREFVKIMLELKHDCILEEFIDIYNMIVGLILPVDFKEIEKEESRTAWLEKNRDEIVKHIEEKPEKFTYLTKYLREDGIETKKLLLVELYCFLAEKFNFNINEYYSEAFSITLNAKTTTKKVKPNEEPEHEA